MLFSSTSHASQRLQDGFQGHVPGPGHQGGLVNHTQYGGDFEPDITVEQSRRLKPHLQAAVNEIS